MSFSRELKDFAANYAASRKQTSDEDMNTSRKALLKAQTDLLNDPTNKELANSLKKAQIAHYGAADRSMGTRDSLMRDRMNLERDLIAQTKATQSALPAAAGSFAPSGPAPGNTPVGPAVGPQSALSPSDAGAVPAEETDQFAAKGGLITARPQKKFADGGAVDDEETPAPTPAAVGGEDDTDPVDDDPDSDPDHAAGITDISSARRRTSDPYGVSHLAARSGLAYTQQRLGLSQRVGVADQGRIKSLQGYLQGAGAAPPSQMEEVRKAVDPKGEMSESQRNLLALGAVYEHFAKNGDVPAAQRAAAGMVQYYRQVFDRYTALSKVAASKGDLDGAMTAAMKAHANVPDGKDLKVSKNQDGTLSFSITDGATGQVIQKGVASPQQMLEYATKGAAHDFDDLIVRAGGERAQVKAPGTPKLSDRNLAATGVEEVTGDKTAVALPAGHEEGAKNIAADILRTNSVSKQDAVKTAAALLDPKKPADTLTPREDGGADLKLDDGRTLTLPKNAYLQALAIRGKVVGAKAKADADEKAKTAADASASAAVDTARTAAQKAYVPDSVRRAIRSPGREAVRQQRARDMPPAVGLE